MTVLGSPDAPVTIEEFSDFQCPYCRQHALEILPQIKEAYIETGLVRYVVKDFPLPSHPNATAAAEAARCAGGQGAYWAMHGLLFDLQKQWSSLGSEQVIDTFMGYAQDLALDRVAFRQCLDSGEFGALVRLDVWEGGQAGVRGTPSFRINGQLVHDAYPFETFQELIEAELDKARQVP
jgi:protein-disulfide isomerase